MLKKFIPGRLARMLLIQESLNEGYSSFGEPAKQTNDVRKANLVSSQLMGSDMHAPILDIDFHAELIPSTREDHFHLYLDKPMTYKDMMKLFKVLAEVGIIEEGYYNAAKKRKMACLRLPWIKKRLD